MNTTPESHSVASRGRRAKPRLRLGLPARLMLLAGNSPCVVEDISETGARVAVRHPVTRGADAVLYLLDLECFGAISWQDGASCGIEFETPLPSTAIVSLRQKLDHWEHDQLQSSRQTARTWAEGGKT